MVPIVVKPEDYVIAAIGDPLRTNAYFFAHNGVLGYTVGKPIQVPKGAAAPGISQVAAMYIAIGRAADF